MMKKRYLFGYSLLLIALGLQAQDKTALKYAKTITAENLKTHLSILASDEYEGRETGKKGQKMAAEYISNHFKSLGLEGPVAGSYYQTFDLSESSISQIYLRREDEKKYGFEDFLYYSRSETMGEELLNFTMTADTAAVDSYEGSFVVFSAKQFRGFQRFVEEAKDKGAAGFVMILENKEEYGSLLSRVGPYLKSPSLRARDNDAPKLLIGGREFAEWIFSKPLESVSLGETTSMIFNADYLDKPVSTENVLGFLKGSEKPDEVLVITSHYDHIGITDGEINNGADDDGSGTTAVLEIAEAFAMAAKKNKGPARSLLFMTVTGEEKGLLGSQYYTDTDPIFPLENTIVNLNIDMIGRIDPAHEEKDDYVYLIGSDKLSQELHDLSEQTNKTYTKLDLDYTYNDENDPNRFYYRSDHYNFAKNNIPIIFYFNGTHDDYHQPSDEVDKIAFDLMERRARLIFHTAWEIANREERISVDENK